MNPIRPGKTFHADLLAGLAVGLLLVPQAMSYAQLAGLPPSMGLWCAAIAAIVGAIFGHCHQLNTGPVAMTAVVSAGALTAINAVPGTPEWLGLASLLCLLVGVVRLGLAAIRGAVIADLISQPVMAGFSIAAAIVIPITQLPFFLGVKPDPGSALFLGAAQILGKPQDWHLPTIAMGLGCLLALWALKRWAPRWPGMLTVIVAATLVAWIAGYTGQQVQALPLGFPALVQPTMNWQKTLELLPGAMLVAIIGLAEVVMVTRASAAVTKQDIAIDRELSGQGAAALATACIAPIVPSGSVSRSMLTLREGGRTRLAAIISGIVALVAALFCGPLLQHLPMAALAAGVIAALLPLLNIAPLRRAWRVSRSDGIAGTVALIATLVLAPRLVEGLLLGVGVCLFLYFKKIMRPQVQHLSLYPDGSWRDAVKFNLPISEEIIVLRPHSRLSFASAASIEDDVLTSMAKYPRLRLLVLSADGINDIDASGVEMLLRIHERAKSNNIIIAIAGAKIPVITILERSNLPNDLWKESQYNSVSQAISSISLRCGLGQQPWDPEYGP